MLVLFAVAPVRSSVPTVEELRGLSLEELSTIEVTSVFKRPVPLSRTPASAYVITAEDIRRSGAQSLPEALRLAPNLMVAQRGASEYAISARGFNWFQLSNKLLVLIDGRSIYTPLHAGVFWNQQQVLVEDIERIEVISGPAGTIWGANAVNGVINVITRYAGETTGGLAVAEAGNVGGRAALRYGEKIGDIGAWRAYGLGIDTGQTMTADEVGRDDDMIQRQAGFRADWSSGADSYTLQGDIYRNSSRNNATAAGGNLLGRWNRRLSDTAALSLQTYYDQARSDLPGLRDRLETFDIEAKHNLVVGDRHAVTWGGGFRHNESEFDNQANFFVFDPPKDNVQIANIFAQDSISLTEDLVLTVGAKLEYSSYSGTELLPSARVAWHLAEDHMLWSAVSRAVRTPSRIDRELEAPGFLAEASESFDEESLIAYEIGYRGQPTDRSSFSATFYYHDYSDLRVLTVSPSTGLLMIGNAQEGRTTGVESWGDYRISSRWRMMAGVNLFWKNLELGENAITAGLVQHQGNDPEHQVFLRSYYDFTDDISLAVGVRIVDDLPSPAIPGYTAVDARLGWQVTDNLELSLVGTNLLDPQHPETGEVAERGEIPRSIYLGARWRF